MRTLHNILIDTQANIEAMTTSFKGMIAYGSDINRIGAYNGSSWDWWSGSIGYDNTDFIQASDTKAQGTHGGTFTQDAWQTRDINTEDADADDHMSISSNQITLEAGTYRCLIFVPAMRVEDHWARLFNTTSGSGIIDGSSAYSSTTGSFLTYSIISGQFTIEGSQALEIQHYCDITKATDGFGHASDFAGRSEKYTIAMFWKEGVATTLDQRSCDGRLTLTSGIPVTTSDVTAATSVYFTPYKGNRVSLYNAPDWEIYSFTERTLSLSGLAADTNFDIFLYNDAGTLTLEVTAWTDATTRATALVVQDGVYVKSGATDRRYLGTIRTTGTIGQCEDSSDFLGVWNYYNRVNRKLYKGEATSHQYNVSAWRAWNNDTAVRVSLVIGVEEEVTLIDISAQHYPISSGNISISNVGYDSTTSSVTEIGGFRNQINQIMRASTSGVHKTGIGFHFYQIVEYGSANNPFFTAAKLNLIIRC